MGVLLRLLLFDISSKLLHQIYFTSGLTLAEDISGVTACTFYREAFGSERSRSFELISLPFTLTCPSDIDVLADPVQIYRRVYWPEPTAKDEYGNVVSVRQIKGKASGKSFTENDDQVVFEAKDKHGSRKTCTMNVRVKVVRCKQPTPISNGYFICHPSTDFIRGGQCDYGCYYGFDLVGERRRTCMDNGEWSSPDPKCSPWMCPVLPAIEGAGEPSCTKEQSFRSICTYKCSKPGYDMPSGVGSTYVCSVHKNWEHTGNPKCIDVEAPVFDTCPSTVIAGTDNNSNVSSVTWKNPEASDNSGESVNVALKSKHGHDRRIPAGQYEISYSATDQSGNTGTDCAFDVVVRDMKCARIYPTPFLRASCPQGVRTGATCDISCDPGTELVGNYTVSCNKSALGLYGAWAWFNNTQYFCNFTLGCPDIEPPKKGAIVCANWMGGRICQVICMANTYMPGVDLSQLYFCDGNRHQWTPSPALKPCQDISAHGKQRRSAGVYFKSTYFGNCEDKSVKTKIGAIFNVLLIKNNLYTPRQPESEDERPRAEVFCGEESRRKRSSDLTQDNVLEHKSNVTIRFHLFFDSSTQDTLSEIANQYLRSLEKVRDIVVSHQQEVFGNNTITEIAVYGKGLETICDAGSILTSDLLRCVSCPSGTYYDSGTLNRKPDCVLCGKSFFQDETGQSTCKRCPEGTTTVYLGAEYLFECEVACGPEFDIRFTEGNETSIVLTLNENTIVEDLTLSFWLTSSCTENDLLTIQLANEDDIEHFSLNMCGEFNSTTNCNDELFLDEKWHFVVFQVENCSAVTFVDGINITTTINSGPCRQWNITHMRVSKQCRGEISLSQLHVWRGIKDKSQSRRCFGSEQGDLVGWQEFDDSVLNRAFLEIPSQCDDYDECLSRPCLHGRCNDKLDGFSCTCDKGFKGQQCDVNIDDCMKHVCVNGATCVDGIGDYTCTCVNNFTGRLCEIQMVNGKWTEWGNWSECSTSCGEGQVIRTRLCNNPTPDNGGKYCIGSDIDTRPCHLSVCAVCPKFVAPTNASADCINKSDEINCTIFCDKGFEFDIESLPEYFCGPDTGHVWNFETDANPNRRLPKCKEILPPKEIQISYSANYVDLTCSSDLYVSVLRKIILDRIASVLERIPCMSTLVCTAFDSSTTSCPNRSTRSIDNVGIQMTFGSIIKNVSLQRTVLDIDEGYELIKKSLESGEFTINMHKHSYVIDLNTTSLSGVIVCPVGHTRVGLNCVPCGSGSYLNVDYCERCPVGQYQDQDGQLTCVQCPDRTSTLGEGSDTPSDCSVLLLKPASNVTAAGLAVGIGASVVFVFVFLFVRYRNRRQHTRFNPWKGKARSEIVMNEVAGSSGYSAEISSCHVATGGSLRTFKGIVALPGTCSVTPCDGSLEVFKITYQ
ncbi:hypothetical protein DPMN_072929 [Dreissena polymorpha]|uniref:Sushi, von Willebrand factor type A, EGF and pentraxin domain-containing protein 1 n=1 Tax=Dreissena polymorpha TaxID=45954 RepID=A0A9D4HA55_DREPO|nr:hypothetical protein DPMN_072929 [Dreissena polymorpha]